MASKWRIALYNALIWGCTLTSDEDHVLEAAAWLAQLGEHRSVEREVAGSSPGRTNTQGLNNNWEESAAFVMTSANG